MKRLIYLPILFLSINLFGQIAAENISIPDSLRLLDINTGETIFKFDTLSGITFPDGSNQKTAGGSGSATSDHSDAEFSLYNSTDLTKIMNTDMSGIATGTIRTLKMANKNIDLALLDSIHLVTRYDIDTLMHIDTAQVAKSVLLKGALFNDIIDLGDVSGIGQYDSAAVAQSAIKYVLIWDSTMTKWDTASIVDAGSEVGGGTIQDPTTLAIRAADEGPVTGNTRGTNSVDLQTHKGQIIQVASGDYSVIGGGDSNKASGDYSVTSGGYINSPTGYASTISGGFINTSIGNYSSIIGGTYNTANTYGEAISGLYATDIAGSATNYVATEPIFRIGNGTSVEARSDAFKILKNGNTTINGSLTFTGDLTPKIYNQSAEPNIPNNSVGYWVDSDDSKYYMIIDFGGTQKKIELL